VEKDRFVEFSEWYNTPKEQRIVKTVTEWSKINHVSTSTLVRWGEIVRNNQFPTDLARFVDHLKKLAFSSKGNSKDRELYARIKGWLVEKKEETHKYEPTPTDYIGFAQKVITRLREDYLANGGVCPVCGFDKALRNSVCVHPEPEHTESREVAAVALPSGLN